MNKREALKLLRKGEIRIFNDLRHEHPNWVPDFSNEDISRIKLFRSYNTIVERVDLFESILIGAKLPRRLYYVRTRDEFPPPGCGDGDRLKIYIDLTDAIIDGTTSGPPLDELLRLGAKYMTNDEVVWRSTATSKQVFISYAWANSGVVSAIEYWLRLKGFNTKIDKRDFFAGSRIRDEILRLMKSSDIVLVFHSFESKDKPWVEFERELVSDLQMSARRDGSKSVRVIYVVIDDTPLPSISEENRLAIMAKGKHFEIVCQEIYHHILGLTRNVDDVDLSKWRDYVF